MHNDAHVCRTCLRACGGATSASGHTALPLANTFIAAPVGGINISYLECLRYCTQLEVPAEKASSARKYPMEICLRCSKALQVAYHFIKLAKESEEKLLAESKKQELLETPLDDNNKNNDNELLRVATNVNGLVEINTTMEYNDAELQEHSALNEFSAHVSIDNVDHKLNENEINVEFAKVNTLTMEKILCDSITANDSSKNLIEEMKENLTAVNQYVFERNKTKVLEETKEIQNAIANNEAEVENNELICVQCHTRFVDIRAFMRHINHHKGITPFRCNYCNYFTCYLESLRKHYKREHNVEATNEMLDAKIDPYMAPKETQYHEITYYCTACSFQANECTDVKVHIMNEHLVLEDIDTHIRAAYNCPDCHRQFKDQKAMHTHFTLTHGVSMGIKKFSTHLYVCEYCEKQFHFKGSLTSHQRVCGRHTDVTCDICSQNFSSIRKFEQHLREDHAVEMIHECEVCNKSFKTPEALQLHRKRHTERHFQCSNCPRNYVNSAELKAHYERVHGTEPKVLCRVCGSAFTHLSTLRQHEKKHNHTEYRCRFCDYHCTTRCNLRIHEFEHTGKPYKCPTCGREFSLRTYLRRHAKNRHSIDLTEQDLADMFHKKFGYPSRYDAFSKTNNSLEITEITEEDIENELKEFGLNFNEIMNDIFTDELTNDCF